MRKGRNAKHDLIIDLTSLLDVIFIILLVVLCNQQISKMQFDSQAQEVLMQKQKAEAEYKLYKDQIEISNNLNQYVCAISIYSEYNPEQITIRNIHILKENQEIENYTLEGSDTSALDDLRASLIKYIEENSSQPVILSLNENDEKILYRDEKAILQIFDDLKNEYSNVYKK